MPGNWCTYNRGFGLFIPRGFGKFISGDWGYLYWEIWSTYTPGFGVFLPWDLGTYTQGIWGIYTRALGIFIPRRSGIFIPEDWEYLYPGKTAAGGAAGHFPSTGRVARMGGGHLAPPPRKATTHQQLPACKKLSDLGQGQEGMGQNGAGTPQKGTRLSTLGWQNVGTTPNISPAAPMLQTPLSFPAFSITGGVGDSLGTVLGDSVGLRPAAAQAAPPRRSRTRRFRPSPTCRRGPGSSRHSAAAGIAPAPGAARG